MSQAGFANCVIVPLLRPQRPPRWLQLLGGDGFCPAASRPTQGCTGADMGLLSAEIVWQQIFWFFIPRRRIGLLSRITEPFRRFSDNGQGCLHPPSTQCLPSATPCAAMLCGFGRPRFPPFCLPECLPGVIFFNGLSLFSNLLRYLLFKC